jgi:hypothetical protein
MNQPVTRQRIAPRRRRIRAELRTLEARVSELERTLVGRVEHLADRVSVLERWCPFLPPRPDAGSAAEPIPASPDASEPQAAPTADTGWGQQV